MLNHDENKPALIPLQAQAIDNIGLSIHAATHGVTHIHTRTHKHNEPRATIRMWYRGMRRVASGWQLMVVVMVARRMVEARGEALHGVAGGNAMTAHVV
jgi:hypothetical protein